MSPRQMFEFCSGPGNKATSLLVQIYILVFLSFVLFKQTSNGKSKTENIHTNLP